MSPNRPASVEHPIEMISAYMDGRLEAVDRARVHEHLRDCAACQAILADFRALAAAARREEAPPVPSDLVERIGRRIHAEPAARADHRWRFLPRARLPLATAAAVLVLASLWVVWRGRLPGERLAESRSDVARPESPSPGTSPEPAPLSQPGSEVAGDLDVPGGPGQPTGFAPSPQVPPPSVAGGPPIKKEGAAQGGAFADREENKMSAARSREAVPAPEENLDGPNTATGGLLGESGAEGQAAAAQMAAMAKSVDTAGTTLVIIMPEARVSVLSDLGVVLTAGDYICALPTGGAEEVRALAELHAYAAGKRRPAAARPDDERVARPDSPEGGAPRELVVPAPPKIGPLPPEAAAEMHRRVWILLRDSLLARAEAQCGPAPPALHPER